MKSFNLLIIDGDCVFTTLETCFDLGGNYAGFGTDCASTICESTCEGDISGNGDLKNWSVPKNGNADIFYELE